MKDPGLKTSDTDAATGETVATENAIQEAVNETATEEVEA